MTIPVLTSNYRVRRIQTIGFTKPTKQEAVIWEGADTLALSREYPRSRIFGADPLGHAEIEDGFIRTDFVFERQSEDGNWTACNDPRRRSSELTDLERAIDAENRRDFPGDYITEDDDSYYGEECPGCDGYGCERCMPNAKCKHCFDNGCDICIPVCASCHVELNSNEGPICNDCQQQIEAESAERDADFMSWLETQHFCPSCGNWLPKADAMCATCGPRCTWCHQPHNEPERSDGDLCNECEQYLEERYAPPKGINRLMVVFSRYLRRSRPRNRRKR